MKRYVCHLYRPRLDIRGIPNGGRSLDDGIQYASLGVVCDTRNRWYADTFLARSQDLYSISEYVLNENRRCGTRAE
jgi:hypothetical protein